MLANKKKFLRSYRSPERQLLLTTPSPISSSLTTPSPAAISVAGPSSKPLSSRSTDPQPSKKRRKNSDTPPPPTSTRVGMSRSQSVVERDVTRAKSRPRKSAPAAVATKPKLATNPRAAPDDPESPRTETPEPPVIKVPRVGMGELYPPPPISDIRTEARYIIQAAAKHREQERLRRARLEGSTEAKSVSGGERPKTPSLPERSTPSAHTITPPAMTVQNGHSIDPVPYATPVTSAPQPIRISTIVPPATGSYIPQTVPAVSLTRRGSATSSVRNTDQTPPETSISVPAVPNGVGIPNGGAQPTSAVAAGTSVRTRDDFDAAFAKLQASYDHQSSAHAGPARPPIGDESVRPPPVFTEGQKPLVALTPITPLTRAQHRSHHEASHAAGLEGLPANLKADADGFVRNVRVRLVNLCHF